MIALLLGHIPKGMASVSILVIVLLFAGCGPSPKGETGGSSSNDTASVDQSSNENSQTNELQTNTDQANEAGSGNDSITGSNELDSSGDDFAEPH